MQTYGGLAAYRQFITFILVPNGDKMDKVPTDPRTGHKADPHNQAVWVSAEEAQAAVAAGRGHGVGFVFTGNDPLFFYDLDNALGADGQWSPLALQMLAYFQGCYVEVSLSGTGLHIIGSGAAPLHACKPARELRQQMEPMGMELYTSGRFCALTGTSAQGSAAYDATTQLHWLAANYFPPRATADDAGEWTTGPCAEWKGPEDDDELIRRMTAAKGSMAAMLGARATVHDLWAGNADALAQHFPPQKSGQDFDHSDADCALLQHLAFWTGRDCERMDRLFRLSGLMRDKWDRGDYNRRSIRLAVSRCTVVYTAGAPREEPVVLSPEVDATLLTTGTGDFATGTSFMTVTQQQEHFKGCVYIRDAHAIWVPDGKLLKPEQFNADYGGQVYVLDYGGEKTTRKAWECFTESQVFRFPRAHEVCFRPECPPGAMVEEEGFTMLNTYVPVVTRREHGDPAWFLDLMARLLPNDRDRTILISYMAAMVQNPGAKFQWWPVIQGTEGNGKSAIIRILTHCVGNRYTHLPSPEAMAKTGNQFNSWIDGKLFCGIEEIYVPERRDFLEAFKTTVTNDRIQIEGKGANQRMGDNRCNGVMCTNHLDGVPVTVDSRRYAIFYTAQQTREDKARDGMTGDYFPNLYAWFRGEGPWAQYGRNYGYAVVNDYLRTYTVSPEFNPCSWGLSQDAPRTTSTDKAIRNSLGTIEQELMDAAEEGRPGFAGGWLSSRAVDVMLSARGAARTLSQQRRMKMIESLGYRLHPALRDGRTDNQIPDPAGAGRPRLYVRHGHEALALQRPGEVARAYLDAQARGSMAGGALAMGV